MEQNTFRFYGRSNPLRLLSMAKKLKEQHTMEPVDAMDDSDVNYSDVENLTLRRLRFWRIPSVSVVFPEKDIVNIDWTHSGKEMKQEVSSLTVNSYQTFLSDFLLLTWLRNYGISIFSTSTRSSLFFTDQH